LFAVIVVLILIIPLVILLICILFVCSYCHVEWNRDREVASSLLDSATMPRAVGGLLHVVENDSKFKRKFVWNVKKQETHRNSLNVDDVEKEMLFWKFVYVDFVSFMC
jgi:hypothetical protein